MQVEAGVMAKDPGPHAAQSDAALLPGFGLAVPLGHSVHWGAPGSGANVPGAHALHGDVAAAAGWKLPGRHWIQLGWPPDCWYEPGTHASSQANAPAEGKKARD